MDTFSLWVNLLKTERMVKIYIILPSNKKCGDNATSVATFVATVIFMLDNAELNDKICLLAQFLCNGTIIIICW